MLKKIIVVTLVTLALGLVVIQFVPVGRTNPPVVMDAAAPPHVDAILRRSCYDCHSNETVWPWYSKVAPVSWLVASDVNEGREHMNFSNWAEHASDRHIYEEIVEEIEEGKMPMGIYVRMHADAALSAADVKVLREWAISHGARTDHD